MPSSPINTSSISPTNSVSSENSDESTIEKFTSTSDQVTQISKEQILKNNVNEFVQFRRETLNELNTRFNDLSTIGNSLQAEVNLLHRFVDNISEQIKNLELIDISKINSMDLKSLDEERFNSFVSYLEDKTDVISNAQKEISLTEKEAKELLLYTDPFSKRKTAHKEQFYIDLFVQGLLSHLTLIILGFIAILVFIAKA